MDGVAPVDVGALLLALDLLGVVVFAFSGALLGVRKRLDVFGVVVLAVAAALGGGILRDVLLGAVPPAALERPAYLASAIAAGLVGFVLHRTLERIRRAMRVFDAAGLGLFAVAGTLKALDADLGALSAVLLGVVTGAGGGVVRDVLADELPLVLQREIYAVAALIGATALVAALAAGVPEAPAAVAAALLTTALRLIAVVRGWHAPRPRHAPPGP